MTNPNGETNTPYGVLMSLVISLLTPMFLGIAGGNVPLARAAAIETVNGYRAANSVSLIAVVQIIAFGLAAVGSLSLSMDDNVPMKMALRLRGNANACHRSAEQNRRALEAAQALEEIREAEEDAAYQDAAFSDHEPEEPEVFLTQDAERLLAAEAQARLQQNPVGRAAPKPAGNQQAWAADMVREADEITASLPNLPPGQRSAAAIRANVLNTNASSILCATAAPALQNAGAGPASA